MRKEKVWFKNNKGQKIAGLMFSPVKSIGAVIICPGLSEKKEDMSMGENFAKAGFKTVSIDYLGIGESDGTIKDYTLTNHIISLKAAIDFLKQPVFIYGESYGGRVALHTAAEDKRIKAIHLLAPLTYNKMEIFFDIYKIAKTRPIPFVPVSEHIITKEFAKDLLANDLDKVDKKIKCPVEISHGDIDKYVSVEGSKKLYNRLETEKAIHIFKGVGHDEELTDEALDESCRLAIDWFKKYLR